MNGNTDVNCGLSLSAVLKAIPPSSHIFVGEYDRHSHATTSLSLQNGSTAVDIAYSSNSEWGVFYCLEIIMLVV